MYTVFIYKEPFDLKESDWINGVTNWRVKEGVLAIYQEGSTTCYPLTSIGRFESIKEGQQ